MHKYFPWCLVLAESTAGSPQQLYMGQPTLPQCSVSLMVSFLFQLDWATGCPDVWSKTMFSKYVGLFLDEESCLETSVSPDLVHMVENLV